MKLLFALMAALFFVGMPAWAEDCFFGCDDPVYFGVNWKTATSTDVSGVDVHAQGKAAIHLYIKPLCIVKTKQ